MELIRTHDALFEFVFGDPEQMAELLRAALPPAVARAIDGSTLERVPGSFVDKALGERHTDLLFTVRMGDTQVLLYVVPEHKSENDLRTTWQVAVYVTRILDQWCREHPDATELPAVLPLVVYHGDEPWSSPRSPHELVDLTGCDAATAAFLTPHQLHLPYALLDLSRLDEAALDAMRLSAVAALALRFLQFLPAGSGRPAAPTLATALPAPARTPAWCRHLVRSAHVVHCPQSGRSRNAAHRHDQDSRGESTDA